MRLALPAISVVLTGLVLAACAGSPRQTRGETLDEGVMTRIVTTGGAALMVRNHGAPLSPRILSMVDQGWDRFCGALAGYACDPSTTTISIGLRSDDRCWIDLDGVQKSRTDPAAKPTGVVASMTCVEVPAAPVPILWPVEFYAYDPAQGRSLGVVPYLDLRGQSPVPSDAPIQVIEPGSRRNRN